MDKSFACKAGAVLLPALSATAVPAQRLDTYVAPEPGSSFVFERHESGSFGARTSESRNEVVPFVLDGARLIAFDSPNGTIVARPQGGFVGVAGRDGRMVLSWDPPVDLPYPVEVGSSWKGPIRVTVHNENRSAVFDLSTTVEAWEEITVPAGTFQAFRIRQVDSLGTTEVNWLVPELGIFARRVLERSASHAQGPGRLELVLKSHAIRMPARQSSPDD